MNTERCMTQTELAERWRISEATLECWLTESAGPLFLKLGNQVRFGFKMLKLSRKLRSGDRPRLMAGLTGLQLRDFPHNDLLRVHA